MDVAKAIHCDKETYYEMSREELCNKAAEEGFEVIFSDKYTLLIDIDDDEHLAMFNARIDRIKQEITDIESIEYYTSTSGEPHKHIIIKMKDECDVLRRLFLQIFLGSDPVREYLSYLRHERGDKFPSLLLRKKKE